MVENGNYGNCGTTSLAFQLFGDQKYHTIIRYLIIYLDKNKIRREISDSDFAKYTAKNHKDQSKGISAPDINELQKILKINIQGYYSEIIKGDRF